MNNRLQWLAKYRVTNICRQRRNRKAIWVNKNNEVVKPTHYNLRELLFSESKKMFGKKKKLIWFWSKIFQKIPNSFIFSIFKRSPFWPQRSPLVTPWWPFGTAKVTLLFYNLTEIFDFLCKRWPFGPLFTHFHSLEKIK